MDHDGFFLLIFCTSEIVGIWDMWDSSVNDSSYVLWTVLQLLISETDSLVLLHRPLNLHLKLALLGPVHQVLRLPEQLLRKRVAW